MQNSAKITTFTKDNIKNNGNIDISTHPLINMKNISSSSANQSIFQTSKKIIIEKPPNITMIRKKKNVLSETERYLQDFISLNREIAELQTEISPLRLQHIKLQKEIISHYDVIDFDDDITDLLDSKSFPSKMGNYSAMFMLQNELSQLKKELDLMRDSLSSVSIQKYEQEEYERKKLVETLKNSVDQLNNQIELYENKISTYKFSAVYDNIQRQKEEILELSEELSNEVEKHQRLKDQYSTFMENNDIDFQLIEDVNLISRLKRKLENERRNHFEKCETLISLRKKQSNEILEVTSAINRGCAGLRSDTEIANASSFNNSENLSSSPVRDINIPQSDLSVLVE